MNLLILQPSVSGYEVLIDFSNKLLEATTSSSDHMAFQYIANKNLALEDTLTDINKLTRRFNITHVFGFNAVYLNLMPQIENQDLRYFGWLVDYPTYHTSRLDSGYPSKNIFTSNPQHSHFIHAMTQSTYAGPMHLGVSEIAQGKSYPMHLRPFDVVFIGSWMDLPEKPWEESSDELVKKLTQQALDILLSDDSADAFLVLDKKFKHYGIDLTQNTSLMNTLVRFLDMYMRKYLRLKMMRSIVQSGLKTLIVGTGWSDHFSGDHLYFHDPVDNHLIGEIYKNCKIAICLNSNNGGCERAYQAIASGCGVFSFGGLPIERMAQENQGIRVVASHTAETHIAAQLIHWRNQIIEDTKVQPDPDYFLAQHSWQQVAKRLTMAMNEPVLIE